MSNSIPRGAVDLGALAAQKEAAAKAANAPAGVVKDVTTATFEQDVIQQSMTVPVVLDLWATWCEPCKQLSPILEALAAEGAGKWLLAKIDVDAEQQIAQAFQVQSIPSVFAVIKGQPLPLFQGALPKEQIAQVIEALLAEAAKNGVTGTLDMATTPEQASEPENEDLVAAFAAMESGDWVAADAAFGRVIAGDAKHTEAIAGRAAAQLYERVGKLDPAATAAAAETEPGDVKLQIAMADLSVAQGDAEGAFDRLITLVKNTVGDERAQVREHLIKLFDVVGDGPLVAKARTKLANALF